MKAASTSMERRLPSRCSSPRSTSPSQEARVQSAAAAQAEEARVQAPRRRSRRPAAKVVTKIFTRDKAHAVLLINPHFLLGGGILQSAKSLANSVLGVDVSVDDFVRDVPHDCGGGWPDVHVHDDFVAYSQVTAGEFKGTTAMSRGSNQKIRMQGVAIGLVLSVVVTHGIGVLPEHHQHIVGLNELVEQAVAAMKPSIVEPRVTRTLGGSSRSSREAQPPVETRTDRSHRDELRQFRKDMTLVQ